MASRLVNFGLYQVGWFCCVLGAAHGRPGAGALAGLALIGAHLTLLPRRAEELRVLVLAGLLGGLLDSLHSCAGLLTFRSGYVLGCLAPPWIVVMWMQFATLLRFGLSYLLGRYALGALLGALGGPLAFWIGGRLGAVRFEQPEVRGMLVLGLTWAGAVPLLAWSAGHWIGGGSTGRYRAWPWPAGCERRPTREADS